MGEYAALEGTVMQQAIALSYIDVIHMMSIVCFCLLPLAFLLHRSKPGAPVARRPLWTASERNSSQLHVER